ncbi:MAG: outer membrane beta-barrel protein [Bacteriovoracaceae bacterium]|nr:outer membrane beta-barrel protein [Bacteriovoracaceae bacterium]
MKNLIAALVLVGSVSAFAQDKNMVSFDLGGIGALYSSTTVEKAAGDEDTTTMNILVNYAWKVHSNVQVKAILGYATEEVEDQTGTTSDATMMTYGVGAIWNFDTDFKKSLYVGASYVIQNIEEDVAATEEDSTAIVLEVGKRMSLGSIGAANFNWSPSFAYQVAGSVDDGTEDADKTGWTLNILKIDVLF